VTNSFFGGRAQLCPGGGANGGAIKSHRQPTMQGRRG